MATTMAIHDRQRLIALTAEIREDIPRLLELYPRGVSLLILVDYYGAPLERVKAAAQSLCTQGVLECYKTGTGAHIYAPAEVLQTLRWVDLSEVQRRVCELLLEQCNACGVTKVKTNFNQLRRILDVSYGGLRAAIEVLERREYIRLIGMTTRGSQKPLTIELLPKLLPR